MGFAARRYARRMTAPMPTLSNEDKLELLYWMKLTRAVDDRTEALFKQGKIPGVIFSQRGHEAIAVGAAYALQKLDVVAPMHRDLGAYLLRGMSPGRVFAQAMARSGSPSRGRDANTHSFGDLSLGIIGYISHLPQSMPLTVGAAFAFQYRGEPRVALTFTGDGASSEGAFSESLNLAAVLNLPAVFVLENNRYAYSTPTRHQYAVSQLVQRGDAFGIPGVSVQGNDVLAVWQAVTEAAARARSGAGPTLIEAHTMRMRGHAIHDPADYVPSQLLQEWKARDPIITFSKSLRENAVLDNAVETQMDARVRQAVDEGVAWAEASPLPEAETVTNGVYA